MSKPRRVSISAWGRRRIVAWSAAGLAGVLSATPLVLLAVWSAAGRWLWPDLVPAEWSLRAWSYVCSPGGEILPAVLTSLGLGAAVTALALAIALPAGRALALHSLRGKRGVLLLLLAPVLASPLAATMGVHRFFISYRLADSTLGVLLVHLIPAVPYATLMVMGSFTRMDPALEEQARTLGAPPLQVWCHVTLPAVAPGMAVAGAFAFIISWSQYLTTLFIGGGSVLTLPLLLVAFQRSGDEAVTAALSLVFLAPLGLVMAAVVRAFR